jgi:dTDP-4-amino-4,6-dideoxygalactose transaminase
MKGLREAAPGTPIIEDAAHAFPVTVGDRYAGTLGRAGVFSFYANKTITTGEGGMVTTDDDELAARVALMRFHGVDRQAWSRYTDRKASWRYAVVEAGYKYNMTDLAAAIGRVQLTRAADLLRDRRGIAGQYHAGLSELPFLRLPQDSPSHAWHLYLIRLRPERLSVDRDEFVRRLAEAGVGTSVHYIPLHIMPYYAKRYSLAPQDFPVALGNYEQTISLPIYPGLTRREVSRVIETIRRIGVTHSVAKVP